MMLFDVLGDVMFFKKGDVLQSVENEGEISPYMLNRWMSMYSPETATLVNQVNNKYWKVLENKRDWYRFNLMLLPRNRYKKIEYIKKEKKEKTPKSDDDQIIEILARNLELSVREVKSYVAEHNIDLAPYRKTLKNDKKSTE